MLQVVDVIPYMAVEDVSDRQPSQPLGGCGTEEVELQLRPHPHDPSVSEHAIRDLSTHPVATGNDDVIVTLSELVHSLLVLQLLTWQSTSPSIQCLKVKRTTKVG